MHPMLGFFVPSSVRNVYFSFKDLFQELGFSYSISCGLMLYFLFGYSSLSDLVRNIPFCPSVSSLSEHARNFKPNRIMRRNQKRILKKLAAVGHGDFCFAIDDTANPKYGDGVFGASQFRSSAGPYFGQKVLVLAIVDLRTRIAYPVSYVFLTSTKDPDHVPGNVRALELIEQALHGGFPPLPVTADSWFDSKEFIAAVHKMGCDFAGELKSNRLARINSAPGNQRKHLNEWFKDEVRKRLPQTKFQKRKEKRGKVYSSKTLFINELGLPLSIIAVYNRKNGRAPFAFYATTNPSMTGVRLWRLSRARWAIEVLFRDLKQSLGFGSLTAGGEGGAHLSVCIPMILLTSIRLDASDMRDSTGKETIGTTVKRQRESSLTAAIDLMVHNAQSERLTRLKARRKNPNQKPTNLSGEKKTA